MKQTALLYFGEIRAKKAEAILFISIPPLIRTKGPPMIKLIGLLNVKKRIKPTIRTKIHIKLFTRDLKKKKRKTIK